MNQVEAQKHFPLWQIVFQELVDDSNSAQSKWRVAYNRICSAKEWQAYKSNAYRAAKHFIPTVQSGWSNVHIEEWPTLELAAASAALQLARINQGLLFSGDYIDGYGRRGTAYPPMAVVYEEFVYGKDNGNSWDDPENDIRKSQRLAFYSLRQDGKYKLEYENRTGEFPLVCANIIKLMPDIYDATWHSEHSVPNAVMFKHNGVMFKKTRWIEDQKCICGEAIDSWYRNDWSDTKKDVKVDIIQTRIFLYEANELVITNGRVYMNGEMLMTQQELADKLGCEVYHLEMMYGGKNCPNITKKIKELFPQAESYETWQACGSLMK